MSSDTCCNAQEKTDRRGRPPDMFCFVLVLFLPSSSSSSTSSTSSYIYIYIYTDTHIFYVWSYGGVVVGGGGGAGGVSVGGVGGVSGVCVINERSIQNRRNHGAVCSCIQYAVTLKGEKTFRTLGANSSTMSLQQCYGIPEIVPRY